MTPSRSADGSDDPFADAGERVDPVRFEFAADGALGGATLTVAEVRDRDGDDVDGLSSGLQDRVDAAESGGRDDAAGEDIMFVNGSGIRVVDGIDFEDPTAVVPYRFVGLTSDGRFLVEFIAISDNPTTGFNERSITVADRLIASLFVDVSADALTGDATVTECTDDAQVIESVTVPNGTEVPAGEEFVKTWRVRNTGTCAWTSSYSWAFAGGHAFTIVETTDVDRVGPGDDIDLSVRLRAPETDGSFAGQWQLIGDDRIATVGPPAVLLVEVVGG